MPKRKTADERNEVRSDSEHHHRACGAKLRFTSKKVVLEHISVNRRRGIDLRWYKCRVCRGFHLTSSPLRQRAKASGATG